MPPLFRLLVALAIVVVLYVLRVRQSGFKWEELAAEIGLLTLIAAIFFFLTRKDSFFNLPLAIAGIALLACANLKAGHFDPWRSLQVVCGVSAAYLLAFHLRHALSPSLERILFLLWLPLFVASLIVTIKSLGTAAPEGGATGLIASVGSRPDEQPVRRSGRGPQRGGGRK